MTGEFITLVSFAKNKNKEADKFLITYVLKHALIWLWQIEKNKTKQKNSFTSWIENIFQSKFFFQYILLHLLVSLYLIGVWPWVPVCLCVCFDFSLNES